MFPVKRRRGTSPSQAPPDYELRQHHVQRELEHVEYSQQNRSVRGPSLAPTSRYDVQTERRGRNATHHVQGPFDATNASHGPATHRSMQFTRSWHDELPATWPNGTDYGGQDLLPDTQPETEAMRLSAASLPGLSLLLHTREERRRAQGKAAGAPQDSSDLRRPGLMPFIGHPERFQQSMDSGSTSGISSPASVTLRDSIGTVTSDEVPVYPFSQRLAPSSQVSKPPYTRGRADSASSNESMPAMSSPLFGATSAFPQARTIAKSSRYLREIDRRNILQRIKNGEKQATLAKEYQVSRAAICNLNKHREVVLSRKDENPLAKHPKKPRPKGDALKTKANAKGVPDLNDVSPGVHEVKSRAAVVLMTALQDQLTSVTDFKRSAYRLLRLVVEEALSLVPLRRVQVSFTDGAEVEGVQIANPLCGVAMKASGGALLLQVFRELEPQRLTGSIRLTGHRSVEAELPVGMDQHNVLLLDLVMASSDATCLAVSSLLARGVREEMVWLVTLSISVPTAEAIMTQFPNIKIVTAQMDRSITSLSGEAAHAKSNVAVHVLVKRFLESFHSPRSVPSSGSEPMTRAGMVL